MRKFSLFHLFPFFPITTTSISYYHHHNHDNMSLSSSQPQQSLTIIITTTAICHTHHHNHHDHLSPSSFTITTTTILTTVTADVYGLLCSKVDTTPSHLSSVSQEESHDHPAKLQLDVEWNHQLSCCKERIFIESIEVPAYGQFFYKGLTVNDANCCHF